MKLLYGGSALGVLLSVKRRELCTELEKGLRDVGLRTQRSPDLPTGPSSELFQAAP